MDYNTGLTVAQLSASLRALARFHATSYSMRHVMKIDFQERYSFLNRFFDNFETDKGLQEFMLHNMDLVEADLQGEDQKEMLEHVKRLRTDLGTTYCQALRREGYQNFLMHGDIW